MEKQVEFLFDFGSPTAYLAFTQLVQWQSNKEISINWTPILLGGVFKASGNNSPALVPLKSAWMEKDLKKWALRYDVPFNLNPHFPINTIELMRGAIGMQIHDNDHFLKYMQVIFDAMWVDRKNLSDQTTVISILETNDLKPADILNYMSESQVKEKLKRNSDNAVSRGAFGAPTFFYNDEMFFGQDRLEFLAESINNS